MKKKPKPKPMKPKRGETLYTLKSIPKPVKPTKAEVAYLLTMGRFKDIEHALYEKGYMNDYGEITPAGRAALRAAKGKK